MDKAIVLHGTEGLPGAAYQQQVLREAWVPVFQVPFHHHQRLLAHVQEAAVAVQAVEAAVVEAAADGNLAFKMI